jgi:predicted phosphodiesterase
MANLFKKAAVLTDLHLGLKGNSVVHNEDCVAFIRWFVTTAKSNGCDTAIVCGDWHNHRAAINIQTLHYSMQALDILNANFSQVFFITGNHDLFYREKRDIHSVAWAGYLPNVTVVNDIITDGNVSFCPWMVGDDLATVKKIKSTYTFGHFELPHFLMNAQIVMPDHGIISLDDFGSTGTVFSGHFHKRQAKKNIWYIGNAFPHNYADANDDARGMMILEWGQTPEFHSWPDQPIYRVFKLSDVLEKTKELLLPNTHARVHLDIDISYEEANFIRDTLIPEYNIREMTLIPMRADQVTGEGATGDIKFESVDQIIIESIDKIESKTIDTKILREIYSKL